MLLAIRRMTTELASSEEIQRAKEYISTGYAITHQRSADLAHQLGALEIAGGRGLELDRELPRLVREVTPDQVRDAVRAMFETKVRVRVLPS
jgi:predicted Zn-dependent peptidase